MSPSRPWRYAVVAGSCAAAAALTMVSAPSQAVAPGINGRLVVVADYDGHTDIYLMNPGSYADRVNLTPGTSYVAYTPQPSPDGTKILFVRSTPDPTDQVYVMNADGTGQTPLTTHAQGGGSSPTWSPDGTTIAFVRGGDIWTMDADGSDQAVLADAGSWALSAPEYSPNGESIAYVQSDQAAGSRIVTEPADGGAETFRTPYNDRVRRPSWSPDGSKLLFWHDQGNVEGLYTKSPTAAANDAATLIYGVTSTNIGEYGWSPQGDRIAFVERAIDDRELFVMDADGTDIQQVTPVEDGFTHQWVSWSAEASAATPLAEQTQGVAMTPIQLDFGGPGSSYAISAGVLPPGLSLSNAGVISGTPTDWGTRVFTVSATGGTTAGTGKFSIHVLDPEDPVATVNSPVASSSTFHSTTISLLHPLQWAGLDTTSGSETFDVRTRRAPWSGSFGDWAYPSTLQGLDVTQRNHPLSAGGTDCFAARATDASGRTGDWSPERCTIAPLDQTAASKSTGWSTKTGSAYFGGSAWQTSSKGKTITRTGAQLKRLGVVATTCPTCGKVDLLVGTTVIGRINLGVGTRTLHRKPLMRPAFTMRSGTVKVKVVTRNKPVRIDALLIGAN